MKFTKRGGQVRLTCQVQPGAGGDEGEWIVVRVQDTGIGIAKDQQAALFAPFAQAGGDREGRFGCPSGRQLARLMGGDLTVASELGRGSVFMLHTSSKPGPSFMKERRLRTSGCS